MKVDLTGVAGGFDPIPAGSYQVTVTDGELKESGPNSKNPGAEYINWEFTVDGGEFDGRKLWYMTSLLPHALFGIKGLLEASGRYTADQINGVLDFEIEDVVGSKLTAIVRVTTYEGDDKNEVKKVKKANDVSSEAESLLP